MKNKKKQKISLYIGMMKACQNGSNGGLEIERHDQGLKRDSQRLKVVEMVMKTQENKGERWVAMVYNDGDGVRLGMNDGFGVCVSCGEEKTKQKS